MTDKMKIIEVKQSVFADNDADAEKLRKELKSEKTFLLNLMSAPGSGKTTTLVQTINRLEKDLKIIRIVFNHFQNIYWQYSQQS